MKITGFTIIKNAIKFDFPVVEAITSILPICDEFVVAVGDSEDETLALIKSIDSPKIKIIHTVWNIKPDSKSGSAMAEETNKALAAVSKDTDWCFYIQSDEVVHEKYLETIKNAMQKHLDDEQVDGLLLKYKHFFGSYDFIGASYRWYRREIRIVRNRSNIYSYRDAQSFRQDDDKKLKVKLLDAEIYHYGYVREPEKFKEKLNFQDKMYHGDQVKQRQESYDFSKEADAVFPFQDTHPAVMRARIERKNWHFDFDPIYQNRFKFKDRFKMFIEKWTGYRVGEFKNYILLK
jgi:Glycosyl transferase family 2